MDGIFKKSTNIFNIVPISIKEPFHYDKNGNLKQEYLEEGIRRRSSVKHDTVEPTDEKREEGHSPPSSD